MKKKQSRVPERILTKKELLARFRDKSHYMTVKDLKEFIEKYKIPDKALVMIQRVEDVYYNEHHWGVHLKEGDHYWSCKNFNKKMEKEIKLRKSKKYKTQYSKIKDPKKYIFPLNDEMKEQYTPAWSCVGYKDKDFLFIDLHY